MAGIHSQLSVLWVKYSRFPIASITELGRSYRWLQGDRRRFSSKIVDRELVYTEELTASSGRLTQR